ncbi:YheC/YheD family endospore coat-associated protein [Paenibacillus alkalitolerans]|uniref:YheC/YheD family endospore coat-associated protein n=1 Tax=Paenibacillus alkalitolerans TaxID=2799335 RepID=UPI0018F430FA|nr:YheC/YheD family protein [Paenibacillus alkalitolerans]
MRSIKESKGYVGILVRRTGGAVPFAESAFFRRLSVAGRRIGIKVYVFSPDWIDWKSRTVRAFAYNHVNKTWIRRSFPLPSVIYDRAFFRTRQQYLWYKSQISKLLSIPGVKLLNLGLTGKWDVYQMLKDDEKIAEALPRTELYRSHSTALSWLNEYGAFVLKPHGGTHGKGVMRVSCVRPGLFEVCGRDGFNRQFRRRFIRTKDLFQWIARVTRGRTYLIQQYLQLATDGGIPFDVRALAQKSGDGSWTVTGTAVRFGPPGSLTSNLHGGGSAGDAIPFLIREYGEEKAASVLESIHELALAIPPVLEQRHGPLVELGIDFGIDRLGRVWVLEANSKPGRSSFRRIGDKNVRVAAVTSPIRYARYVLDRQLGGHKT